MLICVGLFFIRLLKVVVNDIIGIQSKHLYPVPVWRYESGLLSRKGWCSRFRHCPDFCLSTFLFTHMFIVQHWDTPTSIVHRCGSESNNIEIHPPQYYTDVAVNQTTLRYTHLNITQMRQWIKQHWDTPTSILHRWGSESNNIEIHPPQYYTDVAVNQKTLRYTHLNITQMRQWIKQHWDTPTSILHRCGSESNIEIHPPQYYTDEAVNQTTLRYTHLNITQMRQWIKQHWDTPTSILHRWSSESNNIETHPPQYYTDVAVNQTPPKYTQFNITQMWQWIKQHWDTPTSILHRCGSESNNIEIHPPQYYTDVAVNQTTLRYTHLNITQMWQWIKQHWDTPTSILHRCGSESNNIEIHTLQYYTDVAVNQTTLRYTHFNITQMWQWIKHWDTPTSILHRCGSESNNTEIHTPQYYTNVAVNQTTLRYTHLNSTQMWQWIKQHWDTTTSILHKCGSESNNIEIHPPQYYTDVAVNQTTLRCTHFNITQMWQWIKQHWDTPTLILHRCGSESNIEIHPL